MSVFEGYLFFLCNVLPPLPSVIYMGRSAKTGNKYLQNEAPCWAIRIRRIASKDLHTACRCYWYRWRTRPQRRSWFHFLMTWPGKPACAASVAISTAPALTLSFNGLQSSPRRPQNSRRILPQSGMFIHLQTHSSHLFPVFRVESHLHGYSLPSTPLYMFYLGYFLLYFSGTSHNPV